MPKYHPPPVVQNVPWRIFSLLKSCLTGSIARLCLQRYRLPFQFELLTLQLARLSLQTLLHALPVCNAHFSAGLDLDLHMHMQLGYFTA